MPSSTVCWGIELGFGGVKAVKLERDGDNLQVLDFAVIPHKRVLSSPDIDQNEAMRVSLGTLVSQYDLTNAAIAVSVPGHASFARFAKLPPVEKKKIPDIVKFEAVQQVPFPIEEVEWDYQTFQSPDSPDIEVGIFAITRDRVMERLALWEDVGVTPDYVTISPVAAYNAIVWDQQFTEKTPGTVIVDVGTVSTDLVVADAGRVWVATFPIGGHQFTEALVSSFKLSYQKAEKLKREAQQSRHARHVFQAMRPVFADLAQEIQRRIGYYQGLHPDANLTRMIGMGSTFQLPGLRRYLGQQLQLEVMRLDQFQRLPVEGPRAGEFHDATLNLATCYGLAIQGLDLQTIDANLMPRTVLREAMWKRKTKWFGAAAAAALVAGAVSFWTPALERMRLNEPKPTEIERVKSKMNKLKNDWRTIKDGFGTADPRANEAMKLFGSRDLVPHVIDDLGQMVDFARSRAAGDVDAVVFRSFDVAYEPSRDGGAVDVFDPTEYDDRGEFIGGGSQPADPLTPASGGSPRRLRLQLEVDTTLAEGDADRFITDTLQAWVQQNRERDGVPYTVRFSGWTTVGDEGNNNNNPFGAPGGLGPGGFPGLDRGDGPQRPPDRGPPGLDRPGGPGGGLGRPGSIEEIAPLPRPTPVFEPGASVRTYRVTWFAEITDQAPNTGEVAP